LRLSSRRWPYELSNDGSVSVRLCVPLRFFYE